MAETEPDCELSELRQAASAFGEQRVHAAGPGNRLIVPSVLFSRTLSGLGERSNGWRESAAIWAGSVVGDSDWVAKRLYFHHELCDDRAGPLFLELSETAKYRLYQELSGESFRLIALIHTHPKAWVGLSETDRSNQLSSRIGFWSIVVPRYGREPRRVTEMGVHVRLEEGWHRLDPAGVRRRFIVEK